MTEKKKDQKPLKEKKKEVVVPETQTKSAEGENPGPEGPDIK